MVGLRFAPIVLTQLDGNPAYLLSESPLDYVDLVRHVSFFIIKI